jgi:hypothetical protein
MLATISDSLPNSSPKSLSTNNPSSLSYFLLLERAAAPLEVGY